MQAVTTPSPSNRWTLRDIAAALGVARSTVEAYRSRGQMPRESGKVGRTPYWTAAAITPWIDQQRASRKHIDRGGGRP
jgi:predicted DNA-binding transcriptional regulator AlpA